jgi:hypothetical protein
VKSSPISYGQHLQGHAVSCGIEDKVVGPDLLRTGRHKRQFAWLSGRFALPLGTRTHLQALLSPQARDALVIDPLPLALQPVKGFAPSEALMARGVLREFLAQVGIPVRARLVGKGGPVDLGQTASVP